jgi:ABC-type lipoprotein release transport system permease subunit
MFGGFVLAAFFIGWADGTYQDIINTFTRNQLGHIQIHKEEYLDRPSLYKTINDLEKIAGVLTGITEVDSWTPRLFSAGLASVGEKTAGVRIIGIDVKRENRTTNFRGKITSGSMFSENLASEVIIGKGLAKILKAKVGDEVIILSQAADGSIANDKYTIKGFIESGDEIGDRISFYLPLKTAQELLVLNGRVHEIAITLKRLSDLNRVKNLLIQRVDNEPLTVETWQEFAKSFYRAMKADKEGMWIMLLVVMLVVAVGVLNTVLMAVLERRREYGVLKAIGTRPGQLIKMVLLEVNILGLLCVAAGIGVGLLLNYWASTQGYSLSEPLSYGGMEFQTMKSIINARSFYLPAAIVAVSATLVSLFPAIKAARTRPAQAMRVH